jgi:triacylglycerol esterase/lipase EstA (alpha/beta hydrolase family)
MKYDMEYSLAINNEKAVIISHSMGVRTVSYFMEWIKEHPAGGQAWIDKHVHAWMPLGAPVCGS